MIYHETEERPEILDRVEALGFVTFDGAFDLNLIGVRNPEAKANQFDDLFHVVCKDEKNLWQHFIFTCTTDPGLYWLQKSTRVDGTAIMVDPQQARGCYKLDLHAGKYLALCQRGGKIKVWRDANKDQILDRDGKQHVGYFGINIHRASQTRIVDKVERYSAGCTVIQKFSDFDMLIHLCKKQIQTIGVDTFTYTLIKGDQGEF